MWKTVNSIASQPSSHYQNKKRMEKENSEKEANLSPTSKMRKKIEDKKDQSKEETNLIKEMNRYESYSYVGIERRKCFEKVETTWEKFTTFF